MDEPTRWTLIDGVRRADAAARDEFVRRYTPVVGAYLRSRWRRAPHTDDVEDACQEVLARCLEPGGALAGVEEGRDGGLRGYLYGVTRNVALEFERARGREARGETVPDGAVSDDSPSRAFLRAYAGELLAEARRRFVDWSRAAGPAAERRLELLRRRLEDGTPIREIAREWGTDAAALHHDYARARADYKARLLEAVADEMPGADPGSVQRAARELIDQVRG